MEADREIREALERTRVMSNWPAGAVDELCAHIEVRKYHDGDRVIRIGDFVDAVWIVIDGVLLLTRTWRDGRRFFYGHLMSGQLTGMNPVFDGHPAPFDVVARGEATALTAPGAIVRKIAQEHPSVAMEILAYLCRRTRTDYDALELKTMNSIRCQLAKFILWLSRGQPPNADGHLTLDVKISQEDFSDFIGVTRQSINREIRQLVKDGILKQEYRMLVILDQEGLMKVAGEEEELSPLVKTRIRPDRQRFYGATD